MRKEQLVIWTVAAGMAFSLGGCATVKPGTPEALYQEQQEMKAEQRKQATESVAEMPDWFVKIPEDSARIYAVATNYSNDLQMAIDKAVQDAKTVLADKLQGTSGGKMKQFISETGMGENVELMKESTKVSTSLFTNVNLSGYTINTQKVIQQGTGFRAYVLLSYPLGQANRLLAEKVKENTILSTKFAASKAYQELEKEIQDSK